MSFRIAPLTRTLRVGLVARPLVSFASPSLSRFKSDISSRAEGTLSDKPLREPQPTRAIEDLVKEYHCVTNQVVAWGDQDAYGHLNNVQYIRYFESGRMAYLERLKPHLPLELFENFVHGRGIGIIAKSVSCKYKQVVEFPDTLAIATKINNMLPDRFTMSVIAVSHKTETIVAEGAVVVVAYDYRKKDKTLVPEEIVRVVETLEAEANERIANN